MGGTRITPDEVETVKNLHGRGYTYSEIARRMGRSPMTIPRILSGKVTVAKQLTLTESTNTNAYTLSLITSIMTAAGMEDVKKIDLIRALIK